LTSWPAVPIAPLHAVLVVVVPPIPRFARAAVDATAVGAPLPSHVFVAAVATVVVLVVLVIVILIVVVVVARHVKLLLLGAAPGLVAAPGPAGVGAAVAVAAGVLHLLCHGGGFVIVLIPILVVVVPILVIVVLILVVIFVILIVIFLELWQLLLVLRVHRGRRVLGGRVQGGDLVGDGLHDAAEGGLFLRQDAIRRGEQHQRHGSKELHLHRSRYCYRSRAACECSVD